MPSLSGSCWRTSPGWMMPSLTPPTGSSRGSCPGVQRLGDGRGAANPQGYHLARPCLVPDPPGQSQSAALATAARKGLPSTRLAGCCTRPSPNRGIWPVPALSAPWSGRSCSRTTVRILPSFWRSTACRCGWGNTRKGATEKKKATLLQAVLSIGHNAGGVLPRGMEIEFQNTTSGQANPFVVMMDWCERSMSKAILGGTFDLTGRW